MQLIRLALLGLAMVLFALVAGAARADEQNPDDPPDVVEVPWCGTFELKGPDYTLNPNAPPALQRQEVVHICAPMKIHDPGHFMHGGPIIDYHHDRRAFT